MYLQRSEKVISDRIASNGKSTPWSPVANGEGVEGVRVSCLDAELGSPCLFSLAISQTFGSPNFV